MMERVHSRGHDMLAECPGGQCIAENVGGGGLLDSNEILLWQLFFGC